MKTVNFSQMKDGTQPEYLFLRDLEQHHNKFTADRLLRELRMQGEEVSLPEYKVSRLGNWLQTATRAHSDGADIDWVVDVSCARDHDGPSTGARAANGLNNED